MSNNARPMSCSGCTRWPTGPVWWSGRCCRMRPRSKSSPRTRRTKPTFKLTRLHKAGLFEGVTTEAKRVYAYDLVITDQQGRVRRTRDPYSFLPTLGDADLFLFGKGDERRIYDKLGAQLRTIDGVPGASFAVWAPNAQRVSVVGDFNNWDGHCHQMRPLGLSGVWEIFIPGVGEGAKYKFEVRNAAGQHRTEDRSLRLLLRDGAQERGHRVEQPQVQVDGRGLAGAAAAA